MKKNKNYLSILFLLSIFAFVIVACRDDDNDSANEPQSYFAVANRGSNTITYHNTENLSLLGTTSLPDGTQPTYVAYSRKKNRIYTGGLENGMLYEINSETFKIERSVLVGLGAFHLWLNDSVDQLWVNNINSSVKTTTVVDLNTFTVKQTINLPSTLGLSTNAIQHDVIINPQGNFAYVTILDGMNTSHLVQYNTDDFSIANTFEFGGDGHVGFFNNSLYSLSQNAGEIKQHQPDNLTEIENISFSGSHGVTASANYLFAADLPNGRLGVIDAQNNITSTLNTSFDATHNLAVNNSGNKLIVSYSGGAQTKIELFDITNGQLTSNTTLDSGTNPFGVAFIQK
ncbi:hypothetical protein [Polaribacter sp. L3A8]|uniref:hypothetical protein n=1 Tax=Polaribacter sp. L3A8 TaxID=2686361 RepID=UPI00131E9846|nr:hypothetical protein [Polaribacter sp. L3A8]